MVEKMKKQTIYTISKRSSYPQLRTGITFMVHIVEEIEVNTEGGLSQFFFQFLLYSVHIL